MTSSRQRPPASTARGAAGVGLHVDATATVSSFPVFSLGCQNFALMALVKTPAGCYGDTALPDNKNVCPVGDPVSKITTDCHRGFSLSSGRRRHDYDGITKQLS